MGDRINYIKQLNAFWELQGLNGYIKPTSIAVYFSLIQINNTCGWRDPFLATYTQVLNMTGIANSKTYYSALEELSSKGFITWIKSTNQYQAPSFSIKVLYQILEEQGNSTVTAPTLHTEEHGNRTVTIPKQENNKQENKKTGDSNLFSLNGKIEDVIPDPPKKPKLLFSNFWNLYPIKVGKKDAEKKWNSLSVDKQEKIMATLPAFIKYSQFPGWNHPNPSTYIFNERWNDDLSGGPTSSTVQPFVKKRVIDHSKL